MRISKISKFSDINMIRIDTKTVIVLEVIGYLIIPVLVPIPLFNVIIAAHLIDLGKAPRVPSDFLLILYLFPYSLLSSFVGFAGYKYFFM